MMVSVLPYTEITMSIKYGQVGGASHVECRVCISLLLCRTETKPLDDSYTDFFHVTRSMGYGTFKLAVSLMLVVSTSMSESEAFGISWYGTRAFKSPNLVPSL